MFIQYEYDNMISAGLPCIQFYLKGDCLKSLRRTANSHVTEFKISTAIFPVYSVL